MSNVRRLLALSAWVMPAAFVAVAWLAPRPLSAQSCGVPCAKPSFGALVNYVAGAGPAYVAVRDFNGDGKPDLAVANFNSNNVSILLGNGNGTFGPPANYVVGISPSSLAVGDFNGDGKPDLAVTNAGFDPATGTISILLGNGDGTFQTAVNYANGTGSQPVSIAVGDFNGDGKPDLAVANEASSNLSILLGNGDGTFQTAVNHAAGTNPLSIAAGDFNGDGKLDLAVVYFSSNVVILLGNGDGTFQPPVSYAVGVNPGLVAVGDVNGDGKPDLVVVNGGSNNVSVLLGNSDGTFQPAVNYGVGSSPSFVAVGDSNGDGKPDLAVANSGSKDVSILLGYGDGTFRTATNFGAGADPGSVVVADFNGDGKPDLAVANFVSNNISILLNTNCQARRIQLQTDVSSCNTPGTPFGTQPVVVVQDDGGNVIACDARDVVASIEPGTGTSGATLGGATTATAVAGVAAYTNLYVDQAGRGYRLRFTHPAATALSRTFTQGLTGPTITGPTTIVGGVATTYHAGPGYDTYNWLLDGNPIATTETVTVSLSGGSHTLQVSVTEDGCGPVSSSIFITVVPAQTLTSGNSTVGIDPQTIAGVHAWIVDGISQLTRQWYWLRVGSSGPETPLSSLGPPLVTGGGSTVRFDYGGSLGAVTFQIDLTYTLTGGSPGSGESQLFEQMNISAPLERSDIVVHVFRYTDLDLAGTSGGDRAEWVPPSTIRQFKNLTTAEAVASPAPAHFQLDFPPVILSSLSDGSTTTLDDSPASLGPGNVTYAVQWDLPLPTRTTASVSHTTRISVIPVADLSITKTDGQTTAAPNQAIKYTIVATNAGPNAASGASVTDSMPASLTSPTWTCVGAGGGTCTAGGSGDINDTVNLPVGATVTYTVTGTVSANPSSLRNTATVAVPAGMIDPNPANNTATDDDALVCFGETVIVADGRVTSTTIGAGATAWFLVSQRIGNSYSLEFKNTTGDSTLPGTLTVFSADDGCSISTPLTVSDTSAIDPGAVASRRVSLTASGVEPVFRARLVNGSALPIEYSFQASDTTMYSPAWSTNGAFDTFYSFQNTTGTALAGTLTMFDTAGEILGTFPLSVPAGQTASTNTTALALPRNMTGTGKFTHNGPPGSIVTEAAIANFSISPNYVQPVEFRAVR